MLRWISLFALFLAAHLAVPLQAVATVRCQAGLPDDFSATGIETAQPSAPWLSCMATTTTGSAAAFDQCAIDHFLAHTFDLTICAGGADADTAGQGTILVFIRVRGVAGSGGNTASDRLVLGVGGVPRWGETFSALQCLRTSGADCTWSPGDTATFVLNLRNLPPASAPPANWCGWATGTTNILALAGAAGSVDVGVSDDSCIDYVAVRFDQAVPTRGASWGRLKVVYR